MASRTTVKWVTASVAGLCGVAVLTAASMVGAAAWLFADIPGARNDLLREATLGLVGVAFIAVGAIVTTSAWRSKRMGAVTISPVRTALALGSVVVAGALTLVGAGRFTATALAEITAPIFEDSSQLNVPAGNGVAMLLLALGLSLLAFFFSGFNRPTVKRAAVGLSGA